MFKIYIGMALTEAPQEFREEFQSELKQALRVLDKVELLDFIGLEDGTETDVYRHDRNCTLEADLCVFIADYPSIGLGMEIMLRQSKSLPMAVFAKEGARVTRMLKGMLTVNGDFLYRYREVADIVSVVKKRKRKSDALHSLAP